MPDHHQQNMLNLAKASKWNSLAIIILAISQFLTAASLISMLLR